MMDALSTAAQTNDEAQAFGRAMTEAGKMHVAAFKAISEQVKQGALNTSGITPLAFKVLILPDPVEEVTKGGIIIPIEKATKDEYATTRGTIVAVSGSAFSHVTDEEWGDDKPKPGDHVVYTRYAGFRCEGDDGKDYLIVKGEDIHAKL